MATQAPPMVGLRIGVKGSSMAALSSQGISVRVCLRSSFYGNNVGALRVSRLQLACSNRLICNGHGGGSLGSQMNLFDRFARVIKSYANAFISTFEDPEKILEQAVLEMNRDLIKMLRSTTQVSASQKQLENKYMEYQQASEDWYKRGQLALSKGDEELAREALKRRKSFANYVARHIQDRVPDVNHPNTAMEETESRDNASALKTQLDQQKNIVATLVSNTRLLESKIDDAKSKKDTLKARAQSARTATMVSEMVGKVSTSSALATFDKMEEKVMAMESEAEALYQLSRDELVGKFALLEGTSVDDDLARLKQELLKGKLVPGRTAVASKTRFRDFKIHEELDEIRTRAINY